MVYKLRCFTKQFLANVPFELRPEDERENKRITSFLEKGCGCAQNCSKFFDESSFKNMRDDCKELPNDQLDFLIMGNLLSVVVSSASTSALRHTPTPRKKAYSYFMYGGQKVNEYMYI